MKTFYKLLAIFMIFGLAFGFVSARDVNAATICVNTGGTGGCFATLQSAITAATSGDTITMAAGTYTETGQIVINKNLTLTGADKSTTIIKPAQDTGSGGDAGAWILVNSGTTFNVNNVTLDGAGRNVRYALRYNGSGTVDDVVFQNIAYPTYYGHAIAQSYTSTSDMSLTVTDSTFINIGRVGILLDKGAGTSTSLISNNTYYGKGDGDWLDYAFEVGGGANATISNNTITNCSGEALSDGSTSAGIFVHTYFGGNTVATLTSNSISGSTTGISVGYDAADVSTVTATGNTLTNNEYQVTKSAASITMDMASVFNGNTFDKSVMIQGGETIYTTIQEAIDAASPGDTINISGTLNIASVVNVNKSVKLSCAPDALLQVSGTGDRFDISAAATIENCKIQKTDKTGEQNIIRLRSSGITIKNNEIWGQFVIGNGEVSRAMVINAGNFSDLLITGNKIHDLRQPAYISGTHTGTISNNDVYNTKGWVVEGGNLTFTGNTWGTGSTYNVVDIAILSDVGPAYYTDLIAMSAANNTAVIEDQRTTPKTLTPVFVDASAPACTSDCGTPERPYQKIQDGIDRAIPGSTVYVAEGTYLGSILINKPLTVVSTGDTADTIINGNGAIYVVVIRSSNVTFDGFTVTNPTYKSDWGGDPIGIAVGYYGDNSLSNIRVTGNVVTQISDPTWSIPAPNGESFPPVGICVNGVVNGLEIDHNVVHDMSLTATAAGYGGTTGIALYGYDTTPLSTNVSIHDNQVYDLRLTNLNDANGAARGIRIGWGAGSALVEDNVIHDIQGVGIQVTSIANAPSTIDGNTIYNTLTGISLENPTGGSITNNDVSGTGLGIQVGASVTTVPVVTGNDVNMAVRQFTDLSQSVSMSGVFAANTWAAGSTIVGWDILIPPPVHNITKDTYFATIQAAIDDAGTTNGDVIVVGAGTYPEAVNVNKEVTLLGASGFESFTNPVVLSATQAPGKWYTDRFAPGVFEVVDLSGGKVLQQGIRAVDFQPSAFYNTQGRKYDINLSGAKQSVSIDMFVGSDWNTRTTYSGLWLTGFDATNAVSSYPIVAWRNAEGSGPGFYAWFDSWVKLRDYVPADLGAWHTLEMTLTVGEGIGYFLDGEFLYFAPDTETLKLGNVILNAKNYNADYDVYWDNLRVNTFGATVVGQMTIAASNVTVDGFNLTNPGGTYGMYVNPSVVNLDVTNNIFENIGGPAVAAHVKGIYLNGGPDDILISGNTFRNMQSSTQSVNGVYSGDSNAPNPVIGLTITGNTFANLTAARGGYGVLLNNGSGNQNVLIADNTFSGISGAWTHAIGLEGPTPGAVVTGNTFSNLTAVSVDNTAVFFEKNPVGSSVTVEGNFFNNVGYGVAIHPNDLPGGSNGLNYIVNASQNWWGSSCGPTAALADVGKNVTFVPWYTTTEGVLSGAATTTTFAAGTTTEAMNTAIACAVPGSTFKFEAGSHNGGLVVPASRTNLTFTLLDGAVLNASGPCFNVNADFTTIEADNIAMGVCIPGGSANGINIAPFLRNIVVDGLEIRGTDMAGVDLATANGIHFAGVVFDTVLVDNLIHDLDGNGIFFGAQPVALTTGAIDIHGNMFRDNAGNGIEAGSALVPAEFNSWGDLEGPLAASGGDGISAGVDADPFTHVDLYLVSSVTPWANQVAKTQQITYAVKAHMVNVNAADFVLTYDPALLSFAEITAGTDFAGLIVGDPLASQNLVDTSVAGLLHLSGFKMTGVVTGDVTLFSVTFNALSAGTSPLNFVEATDGFGMPGAGSSSNIYAYELVDGSVKVIELPVMTIVPTAPYVTGLPIPFTLNVVNPTTGGAFTALNLDFTLPAGAMLEYLDGSTWVTVVEPFSLGALASGGSSSPQFRVTFNTPGANLISVALLDSTTDPDYQLATASQSFTLLGNFSVTGTFSMQGRTSRAGIPVTFTWGGTLAPYTLTGQSIEQISNNLVVSLLYGGEYTITTNQPRYLNLVTANGKKITAPLAVGKTLNSLELKGGNAVWSDNIINIQDAGVVGFDFNKTGNRDADVNFDGVVNIQDLSLVGGNFDLTSSSAYGSWVPVTLP